MHPPAQKVCSALGCFTLKLQPLYSFEMAGITDPKMQRQISEGLQLHEPG